METSTAKVSNVRRGTGEPAAPKRAATNAAPGPKGIIDARGRTIQLRELTLLDEQDLMIAMGPAASSIPMVLGRAMLAARVAVITVDGEPDGLPIPKTERQYRAMMTEIGKDGLAAVMKALEPEDGTDEDQDPDEDNQRNREIETAKN